MKRVMFCIAVSFLLVTCSRGDIPERVRAIPVPTNATVKVRQEIDKLGASDATTRYLAARTLSELGPKADAAVRHLIVLLDDDTTSDFISASHPRDMAEVALGNIGAPATDPLIAALSDGTLTTVGGKALAVYLLGAIGDRKAVASATNALNSVDLEIRRAGAQALGFLRPTSAIDVLGHAALTDPAPEVRLMSANTLGRYGDDRVIPFLDQAMNDSQQSVRDEAARAIGEIRLKLPPGGAGSVVNYTGSGSNNFTVWFMVGPHEGGVTNWLWQVWEMNNPSAGDTARAKLSVSTNCISLRSAETVRKLSYDETRRLCKYSVSVQQ
jgi:HEAT repeats